MAERTDLDGDWWLPGCENTAKFGILEPTQSRGTTLDLKGSFYDLGEALSKRREGVILGKVRLGQPVTLVDCDRIGLSGNEETLRSRYVAKWVILGRWVAVPAEYLCSSVTLDFDVLRLWLDEPAFEVAGRPARESAPQWEVTSRPSSFQPLRVEALQADLGLRERIEATGDGHLGFGLRKTRSLELRFDLPTAPDRIAAVARSLQRFLALITGMPIGPCHIQVRPSDEEGLVGRPVFHEVELVVPMASSPSAGQGRVGELLLRHSHLRGCLGQVLDGFLASEQDIASVLDVLLVVWYSGALPSDVECFLLTQGLEVLHRTDFRGSYVSREQFQLARKEVKRLLAQDFRRQVPHQLYRAILDKLAWSNEYVLRDRLGELLASLPADLLKAIVDDAPGFVERTANTRNFLTHRSRRLRTKAAQGGDLKVLNRQLGLLLWVLLLVRFGVSPELLKGRMGRSVPFLEVKEAMYLAEPRS
jgi:hypothetical protein